VYNAFSQAVDTPNLPTIMESNAEISDLNQNILQKKNSIDEIKAKQDAYKQALAEKQAEKATLENQLAIFDNRISAMELNIEDVRLNMEATELEIRKMDLQIKLREEDINKQKERIAAALGLLYKEGNKSELEIILLNDNFSDYVDQIKHIKDINRGLADDLNKLKSSKEQLEADRRQTNIKKLSLEQLQVKLESSMASLTNEKSSKVAILDQTKQSENEYQRLLAQAKKEQQDAAWDIANLERLVRLKLAESQKLQDSTTPGSTDMIWPVPKNTITAYFHDPEYPYRSVMEHPAIDIRAKQGTTVVATADGYVARTKAGNDGSYAYIMIVHANGLSTVYGHVSKIFVSEEQFVTKGQTIGLSGGMPGTAGAGKMTTGSHLHLEVRLNGIPVNPLDYLN